MISLQLPNLNLHFSSCLFVDMFTSPRKMFEFNFYSPAQSSFTSSVCNVHLQETYPFHPESWPQVAHKLARHTSILRPFPSHSNVNFKFRAERLVWPISHIMRFKAAGRAITRILKIMIKRRMKNHKKLIHWLRGQQLYLFLFEIPFTVLYRLIHSKWRRPYRAGVMYLH